MPSRRQVLLAAAAGVPTAAAFAYLAQPPERRGRARQVGKGRTVRTLDVVTGPRASKDGAGVKLHRLLGQAALPMLDPFLLLDEFRSPHPEDFMAGFPSHPHRGFETVTLMFDGAVSHKDSVGNAGTIRGGGVQWMTAGRGIIHSEMPAPSEKTGGIWGYQLWVNLPANRKMVAPRYQDLSAPSFVTTTADDAQVRVLAGKVANVAGPIDGVATKPLALDLSLEKGGTFRHPLPAADNALLYVATGALAVGPSGNERPLRAGQIAALSAGDMLRTVALDDTRALFFAAAPLGEPVARRGPFVMNTPDQLRQAFADYRAGRLAL